MIASPRAGIVVGSPSAPRPATAHGAGRAPRSRTGGDGDRPPADAARSGTGLAWQVLVPGTGAVHPGPRSRVLVHYVARAASGTFDDAWTRGSPMEFPLDAVVPGFSEGVQGMVVGEVRRLWIPPSLAYGDPPRAGVPAGVLVFDVALLGLTE